jgi:hypothetical protein
MLSRKSVNMKLFPEVNASYEVASLTPNTPLNSGDNHRPGASGRLVGD